MSVVVFAKVICLPLVYPFVKFLFPIYTTRFEMLDSSVSPFFFISTTLVTYYSRVHFMGKLVPVYVVGRVLTTLFFFAFPMRRNNHK